MAMESGPPTNADGVLVVPKVPRLVKNLHASLPQPLEGRVQVCDTQRNVIDDLTAWTDERTRTLSRINDQADLTEPDAG